MASEICQERKLLVTVRAYPTPSKSSVESSCTACVSEEGEWTRLFPLNWRQLGRNQRFKKYDWIRLRTKRSRDPRPESYYPDVDSIESLDMREQVSSVTGLSDSLF